MSRSSPRTKGCLTYLTPVEIVSVVAWSEPRTARNGASSVWTPRGRSSWRSCQCKSAVCRRGFFCSAVVAACAHQFIARLPINLAYRITSRKPAVCSDNSTLLGSARVLCVSPYNKRHVFCCCNAARYTHTKPCCIRAPAWGGLIYCLSLPRL